MSYIRQTAPPAAEPCTPTHFTEFLGLPSGITTAQAATITALLAGARAEGEKLCRRALARRAFLQVFDGFPCRSRVLKLYYPPLVTVTSVQYVAAAGALQTLPAEDYTVDTVDQPGRIVLAPDKSWPVTHSVPNAVQVAFTAGYNPDPAAVDGSGIPQNLRLGILNLAAFWFQNRGANTVNAATGQGFNVPPYIEKIFTTEAVDEYSLPLE